MGPRSAVAIAAAADYRPETVRRAVAELLAPLGGIGRFVSRGDRVVVKPNFLSAKPVDSAVCTHPEVILAVCEAALDAGAERVTVGDCPRLNRPRGLRGASR